MSDLLLDLTSMSWVEMPELPSELGDECMRLLDAGPDAIAFGGERWVDRRGEQLNEVWIWRSGRRSASAARSPSISIKRLDASDAAMS